MKKKYYYKYIRYMIIGGTYDTYYCNYNAGQAFTLTAASYKTRKQATQAAKEQIDFLNKKGA